MNWKFISTLGAFYLLGQSPAFSGAAQRAAEAEQAALLAKEAQLAAAYKHTSHVSTPAPPPVPPLTMPTLSDNDRINFTGESTTAIGTEGNGWTTYFRQYVTIKYPGIQVFNTGVGGNTTTDLLARLNSTVLNTVPSVVVIWEGINDIAHGYSMSTMQKNWEALIFRCINAGVTKVVLVSPECFMENTNSYPIQNQQINALATWLRQVAQADNTGKVFYCPMREYWELIEPKLNPHGKTYGYLTKDGFHESPLGQYFVADVMLSEFGVTAPFEIAGEF